MPEIYIAAGEKRLKMLKSSFRNRKTNDIIKDSSIINLKQA